ncbi:ABC transporter ATP-binding protein [Bradyrhizobium sp. AS23.2]|uniref:ABC transporter ATP-binding protein n=1 Tax=Bradyrhizobium sp. AS23.2 TaxID=1680155 RepID=UPI0014301257
MNVENLSAGYEQVTVLREVSLKVEAGEAVAILGPNGAGKSTLLRCISGLVAPTSGSIVFDGHDLTKVEAHAIPHLRLIQVPEARHIFAGLSVTENLLVGGTPLASRSERMERLEEIWRYFPALRQKSGAAAGTLSGGQQQMVAIGRALMAKPRMVMLDEPSLGLAPLVVRELYGTLRTLVDEGLTLLVVEQDVSMALKIVDRALVLETGVFVLSGSASELRHNDHVKQVYLGI